MKVSLIWLSLITIGIVLLLVSQKAYEAFSDFVPLKEGFVSGSTSEIQITTCPANSKMYIDNNGRSVCCEGNVENGKCVGRPICTLSESGNDLPTCNTWYAALLDERGRDRCPSSMPAYFEGGKMGRGCTSGRRNKDGTAPDLASAKFCKLYTSEKDELLNEDSCTNQKMLEEAQCIVPNAKKSLTRWHKNIPFQVQCDYVNPTTGLPGSCSEDITTYKQHQYAVKVGVLASNWEQNYVSYNKINWCRPRKMVEIDKTISYDDLKQVSVNPESAAPTRSTEQQKCTFRPGAYAELYPDLKAAFGYDEARLKKHYIDNGLREGRSPCGAIHPQCRFNKEEYYMLNPDVQKAGVDAEQHYKQYGINEGRQVCYPPGQKPIPPPFTLNQANKSRIQNKGTKLCWDVWGAGTNNGTAITTYDCHGGPNQQFTYDSKERLTIAHSGKCVDLSYGKDIVQYDCHDGPNQKWLSDSQGRIRSRANNYCIQSSQKGTPMTAAPCGDGDNMKFQLA
jgi:hypothetical protein